ncbi:MAG: LOG family protein [Alphaproteobacteria bacterium]|nr:LOG family protein [Alphaproteobacteria bacterium]
MTKNTPRTVQAHRSKAFMESPDARVLRIMAEYLEPEKRFADLEVKDTIVFFGSARSLSREAAEAELAAAEKRKGDVEEARSRLAMSRYYEDTRELAKRLTLWSKGLTDTGRRFVVCSGGGPGIMEAANRGASEAKGVNIGLKISIPFEQTPNPYITRRLTFEFHYFFMRKFWFAYFAKAMIVMPGGFGTIDELMEILTLMQTLKIRKHLPIVLFGTEFWDQVLNLDAMVEYGTIDRDDLALVYRTDSVDEAFNFITRELTEHALAEPGGALGPVTEPDGASR